MQPTFSDAELERAFEGAATIVSDAGKEYRCHYTKASSKLLVTLCPHEARDA